MPTSLDEMPKKQAKIETHRFKRKCDCGAYRKLFPRRREEETQGEGRRFAKGEKAAPADSAVCTCIWFGDGGSSHHRFVS